MINETMSLLDESNVRKLFRLLKKYADRKTLELRNTSLELLMADIFFRYVTIEFCCLHILIGVQKLIR